MRDHDELRVLRHLDDLISKAPHVRFVKWSIDFVNTKTTSDKPTAMLNHTESWKVDGVDVVVGVPAGSFYSLQVTRTDSGDGAVKTMWFVKGVGKVKELTNAGHLEELSSYTIAP